VHRSKTEWFRRLLRKYPPVLREGVAETLSAARRDGITVALVTTTSPDNIARLTGALVSALGGGFDLVLNSTHVEKPKPNGEIYTYALDELGESAQACVAIEDNVGGVEAAREAGVTCVAFPNANTAEHDFSAAAERVDRIDYAALRTHLPRA